MNRKTISIREENEKQIMELVKAVAKLNYLIEFDLAATRNAMKELGILYQTHDYEVEVFIMPMNDKLYVYLVWYEHFKAPDIQVINAKDVLNWYTKYLTSSEKEASK